MKDAVKRCNECGCPTTPTQKYSCDFPRILEFDRTVQREAQRLTVELQTVRSEIPEILTTRP